MKIEDGSEPLANPKHEIYALERAAGLSEEDARGVASLDWAMPLEPGEKVTPTRSRIQKQTLMRISDHREHPFRFIVNAHFGRS